MKNNLERKVLERRKKGKDKKSFIYLFAIMFVSFGVFSSAIYAQNVIKNKSLDKVTDSYILTRLGKLDEIPNEDPIYIAKIKDDETMRKDMQMYAEAKKGDYIVVFRNKAYIYDLNNNKILKLIEFKDE